MHRSVRRSGAVAARTAAGQLSGELVLALRSSSRGKTRWYWAHENASGGPPGRFELFIGAYQARTRPESSVFPWARSARQRQTQASCRNSTEAGRAVIDAP